MSENCQTEPTFRDYVLPPKWGAFIEHCKTNALDVYSSGIITTAHLVLSKLMQHTFKESYKGAKQTPEEAWGYAMKQHPGHSGYSASAVACVVIEFSPRGKEFKKWYETRHA